MIRIPFSGVLVMGQLLGWAGIWIGFVLGLDLVEWRGRLEEGFFFFLLSVCFSLLQFLLFF